ncbi:MAG TPA: GH3 auxin-responsive promoter family protein [Myxococcales bacterium]|nr:GH3 auxin-responsive promoter family protein [Myxococcales bacterium]
MWFESSVRWRARRTLRSLRASWQLSSAGEDGWLRQHVRDNTRSLFGFAHRFAEISSASDYQRSVPIRPLESVRPAAAEIRRGLQRSLTVRPPACVAVSEEGAVPLAPESRRAGARLWQLWAAGVEDRHPGALAGGIAVLPEAAPGRTLRSGEVPVVAGELAMPWVPDARGAIPPRAAAVKDPVLRAFVAARFALARDVTLLCARGAADLASFARLIHDHAPSLIRAIHDGALGVFACEQPRLCAALARPLRPDPARARALAKAAERSGSLRPADAWPRLRALAVRSSPGPRAALWPWYGACPVVDAGLFVGAERIGLPLDGARGPCALTTPGLTEFLPAGGSCAPLRQHQLRDGEAYQVIVTTAGGLYRVAADLWVRTAGRRDGAVLVEPCAPPAQARRRAPPHLAS